MYDLQRLKKHWVHLIDRSCYYNNVEQLSEDIGKSRAYLRGMLRNNAVPGVDVCVELSRCLGCTIEQFMDVRSNPTPDVRKLSEQITSEISKVVSHRLSRDDATATGHDVMEWWRATNGRLEEVGALEDRFDLFEVPDGTHREIVPYRLGADSLSARELMTNSIDVYNRTVRPLPFKYKNLILTAHRSSLDIGPVTTMEELDAVHPDTGVRINIEYSRTLAPVTLRCGRTLVLNYSKLFGKTRKEARHIQHIGTA
jgi:transcriptional regulator with XRE-family HTH domain